jgi:hypothetical protein
MVVVWIGLIHGIAMVFRAVRLACSIMWMAKRAPMQL